MNLNVEQALRVITEKAAVVRFLSDSAANGSHGSPDSAVLSGIGTVCADIECLTQRVKRALDVEALDLELPQLPKAKATAR